MKPINRRYEIVEYVKPITVEIPSKKLVDIRLGVQTIDENKYLLEVIQAVRD